METVYDSLFALNYRGRLSFTEAYSLPIQLRLWFIKRLTKQLEDEKDAVENNK